MHNILNDYELQERIALRMEAGEDRNTAAFHAHEELAIRKAQDGIAERRKIESAEAARRDEVRQKAQAHLAARKKAYDDEMARRVGSVQRPPLSDEDQKVLDELEAARSRLDSRMAREEDLEKHKELFGQWKSITESIIQIKKGFADAQGICGGNAAGKCVPNGS
jgi:hypothetical protein